MCARARTDIENRETNKAQEKRSESTIPAVFKNGQFQKTVSPAFLFMAFYLMAMGVDAIFGPCWGLYLANGTKKRHRIKVMTLVLC